VRAPEPPPSEAVKPLGEEDKSEQRFDDAAHARLVEIDAPAMIWPTRDAAGSCSSISSAMKH